MKQKKCGTCRGKGYQKQEKQIICVACHGRGVLPRGTDGWMGWTYCLNCNKTGHVTIDVRVACVPCGGLGFIKY